MSAPAPWSYGPGETVEPERNPRRWLRLAVVAAVVLALALALLFWAARPTAAVGGPQLEGRPPAAAQTPLNTKPPTVILNALDVRSLYPPGYVDFDSSQRAPKADDIKPEDINLSWTYTSKSVPPECGKDPFFREWKGFRPGHYDDFPIRLLMFPASDPGGNAEGNTGYYITILPLEDGATFDSVKHWYATCDKATVSTVATDKDGRVMREFGSSTYDFVIGDAPSSDADDAFFLGDRADKACQFIGVVRGMLVSVDCPTTQREAGAQLFRTVMSRIRTA